MQERPQARTEGLVVERVEDGELVAYDARSQTAHALSREATSVWQSCHGALTPSEIAAHLDLDLAVVERALSELEDKGLLQEPIEVLSGHTRRQAMSKMAKIGGVAFAAPFIYSVSIASADTTCNCSVKPGCTPNDTPVPSTANCSVSKVSGSRSGLKGCDCDCCSGVCYEGTAGNQYCVSATCTAGGQPAPGGNCSACCSGACAGSSKTCAATGPAL